ncbi:MAG: membrane protein insertion efficiency factor YidD [Bacteroidales bacterium]|nr:membrane protein insertion efficiency factor YidD [Bacteroidales bacterium]
MMTFLIIFSCGFVYSQTDLSKYKDLLKPKKTVYLDKNSKKSFYTNMFVFYKKVFSKQDINKCSFYPSCSKYCIMSITENGFFYGFFDTIDRLSRCNGINKNYYQYDKYYNCLIDYPLKKK